MSERFSELVRILERLRSEQGCPWDREQTRETLKPYLIEEAYEVLEAIEALDPARLKEELGDLLLQIIFHTQIASEQNEFSVEDVLTGTIEKIIRRHPHVFGSQKVKDAREVLQRWEDLKEKERGPQSDESALDGLPKALPALLQAHRIQERASRVGFDWPAHSLSTPDDSRTPQEDEGIRGVLAKVREELGELEEAIGQGEGRRIGEELGDLLFSLVNLSRFTRVDPEGALREANGRFIGRFKEMDRRAKAQGKSLKGLSLDELNALWEQAKRVQ